MTICTEKLMNCSKNAIKTLDYSLKIKSRYDSLTAKENTVEDTCI